MERPAEEEAAAESINGGHQNLDAERLGCAQQLGTAEIPRDRSASAHSEWGD